MNELQNCKEELEFVQLESKTNNTSSTVGEITKDLAVMTEDRNRNKHQAEKLQKEVGDVMGKLRQADSEQNRLLKELAKSKQEIESERKRADLFEQQMQKNSTPDHFHMTHLQNAMNAATEKLQQQVAKTNETETRLRKEQKNMEKFKQSTTALCEELKSSQDAYRALKQRFQGSKNDLDTLKAEKKLLTERMARAKNDYLQMALSEKDDIIVILQKLNAPKATIQPFTHQKDSLILQMKENNKLIISADNDTSTESNTGTWA